MTLASRELLTERDEFRRPCALVWEKERIMVRIVPVLNLTGNKPEMA